MKITGTFEVSLNPLDCYTHGEDEINFGRMSIDKNFTGELSASSKGEMLSVMTLVKGSAGYVAIEVVPDSGTSELSDLTGKMTINNRWWSALL